MKSEIIRKIRQDYQNGVTINEIAQKYQVSRNSVYFYAKYADLEKIEKKEKEQLEKEEKICSLAKECRDGYQLLYLMGEKATKTRKECIDNLLKKRGVEYSNDVLSPIVIKKEKLRRKNLDELLICGSKIKSGSLKGRLIKAGLKEQKCEKCGLTEWLDEPIPLQVHHVNGNHNDNRIENLQILCPNCHSKTENFCGKNIRKVRPKHICQVCGKVFEEKNDNSSNRFCSRKCYDEYIRNTKVLKSDEGITPQLLEELFVKYGSFLKMAAYLGFSIKRLKKNLRIFGYSTNSVEFKKYIETKYGKQPHWYAYKNVSKLGRATEIDLFDKDDVFIKKYQSISELCDEYPQFCKDYLSTVIKKGIVYKGFKIKKA